LTVFDHFLSTSIQPNNTDSYKNLYEQWKEKRRRDGFKRG
jgi:hypothetical protein